MKKRLLSAAFLLLCAISLAQQSSQNSVPASHESHKHYTIDSTVVTASRAQSGTPVTSTEIKREELSKAGTMTSLPMLLSLQPSVVASNEGGTGLGYSKMRIRGSDETRINVNINGIALNDAESQKVFWVNIPAISGFLESVQLQRGAGTSVNGAGAFGATLNMSTLGATEKPYATISLSGGSWLTGSATFGVGTGRSKSGLSFDMRYSYNTTEGYVRNAFARLHSAYATLGWLRGSNSFKLNWILGKQRSGITWLGIPADMLEKDRRYNPAGEYTDDNGNVCYYDNEIDNYMQNHLQGIWVHQFNPYLSLSATLNYTRGGGYYENYKAGRKYSEYGLAEQIVDGVLYKRSDVVVRQQMANNNFAASANLKYSREGFFLLANLSGSLYDGDHFGDFIWAKFNGNIPDDWSWYFNRGLKRDISGFLRSEGNIVGGKLHLYGDIQYRNVNYELSGIDRDFVALDKDFVYNFFNPKGGFSWNFNSRTTAYASLSVAHKEPSRSDIKEAIKAGEGDRILPERMLDWEFGYNYASPNFAFSANIYLMEYHNQLLETGKITETGYSVKENVERSYRRGIELSAGWQALRKLRFDGNLALSRNRITECTLWVDRYDNPDEWNPLPQAAQKIENGEILMSPPVVGMAMVTWTPLDQLSFSLRGKYVGKQYYDNTSCEERSLPAYAVFSAEAHYRWKNIGISLYADNLLNRKYVADAWVYRASFADGSADYVEAGFFPQAGFNLLLKLEYSF
ncbi:MAG: TonB-dependent receptor [Bacteroidales bacterium]|nr:TonB-dependent receptor [Bacteroidales bacterium]